MLSHAQVWAGIDGLARRNGLSPSGLAKRAGLDPTTFNPSKRFAGDGRPRWPSTESLSKILEATGEPLKDFVAGIQRPARHPTSSANNQLLPIAPMNEAGTEGTFDAEGLPTGTVWEQMPFPDPKVRGLFALEICGNEMLPLYRDGDVIIIAPDMAIRRGDRVVVKPKKRNLSILLLHQRTESAMEFSSVSNNQQPLRLEHSDIDWVGRIIWASQ